MDRADGLSLGHRNMHYPLPVDIDKPMHDDTTEKIREERVDYNNRFTSLIVL